MAQHIWSLREGGRKSGRAGQREGEISFPEFCFPAWLISLSGLILRADSWEEFSPRRCQTSLRWDYFSAGGGLHCFLRAHEATRWVCVLMTCLPDGNAGLHFAGSEDDAMQKFLTCTLCSIWPRRRGAGQDERWPLSLLLCLWRF